MLDDWGLLSTLIILLWLCYRIFIRLQEDKNCEELLAFLFLEKFLFFSLHILQPWRGEEVKPVFLISSVAVR